MSIREINDRYLARMTAPDMDRVAAGINTANAALTLAERIAAAFSIDPRKRAARLRGRAARLLARAESANPRKVARLRAMAAGCLAEAEALEASF